MDLTGAEDWIREHVEPVGPIETAHEEPWSTVLRVPLADGVVWFKACAPVQSFEPRLTAELFARYPDRVPVVLGHDEERAWLLLGDAGTAIGAFGNPPEVWLVALPLNAELQLGEVPRICTTISRTAYRTCAWPNCRPTTTTSCSASYRSRPEEIDRLRDAYLEPWGRGLRGVFALAMRVGTFAHAIASLRQRDHLGGKERDGFPDRSSARDHPDERPAALTAEERTTPVRLSALGDLGLAPQGV